MNSSFVESLETRRLFAGVTLLATGRLGGTGGWMQTMAQAITAQEGGPSQVPQFILTVDQLPNSGLLGASIAPVAGTGTPQTSTSGEIIVLVNYYNISANADYGSTYIGQVIANYLMNTPVDGIDLASLPIHEIGVSRGAGILDGTALALGQSGVWVDQETYLDPMPIAAEQDPPSAIYDNVEFVDDYWRNDGSASQINDGHAVNGASNLNVYWLDSNDAGYTTPHLAPAGYYIGTIDQSATYSGEGPIYSNWYGTTPTMPARNATGWIYSEEMGAARPLAGVWTASGGTGARTAAGQVGSQWGNVSDLAVATGNTVVVGNSLSVNYLHEDRDSADTVTFYLDTDRNPYNNAFAATLGSVSTPQTSAPTQSSATFSTAGVAPGTYWLCAKITDAAGHTRYTYENVTAPLTVRPVQNGSVAGSQVTAAASYNLTTLGTSDWAHWGTTTNPTSFEHKATGNSLISNVTTLGNGGYGSYADGSRNVTWTDGTPLASDSGDSGYLWANSALGAGYSFTVPAGTTAQTLYVYAGGYSSGATLTAHLSDGSAADFVATGSGTGLYSNFYTITFKAGAPNQTLTVSYVKSSNIGGTGGSVDLMAAALAGAVAVKDTTPPTASSTALSSIISATSATYTFPVTFTDNVAVNAATLSSSNLLITGPGYSHLATLVSTGLTSGPTITATYSIPVPAGGWSSTNDGSYSIALQSNQVADTSGNFASAVSLTGFTVNIPAPGAGSILGIQNGTAPSYNLTTLGTTDWIHWGTGNVASAVDRKATGGSLISNVTQLGVGASYGSYFNTSRNVSWTDGAPLASDAGDDNYIWANNAIGAGYSFTVPAGTRQQVLYVYAGGYSSQGTLTAQLSDGTPAYVATASSSGLYSNFYSITFTAGSANQTLTISYVKSANINGTSGSVDLIAAALVSPDTTPPTAAVTSAPALTSASSAPYKFTVTYTDISNVNAAALSNSNIIVSTPGNTYSAAATLVSTGVTNSPTIVATYSVPAPAGGWSSSSNGTYSVNLQSKQIDDIFGNFTSAAVLGTFSVSIPAAGSGALSGSQAAAASSYNLTALGTTDWIHWGTGNVASAVDRKASGGSQISNVTQLGSGAAYGSYFNTARDVSWTDGSPLASDTGDDNYIWANNAIGAGYSFTVPAGTTAHTLYIYAGGYSSGATLTAHLSGGSAADYVAVASGTGLYTNLYTINFTAASAGQTLTITYVKSSNINGSSGSVDLIAAALV
jgi:hypothetical protein